MELECRTCRWFRLDEDSPGKMLGVCRLDPPKQNVKTGIFHQTTTQTNWVCSHHQEKSRLTKNNHPLRTIPEEDRPDF